MILVAGALGYRNFKQIEELAGLLSEHCTLINYDRRGRGDSTESKPFALERETEGQRQDAPVGAGAGGVLRPEHHRRLSAPGNAS